MMFTPSSTTPPNLNNSGSLTVLDIPYQLDSADYYAAIRHLPYPIWLDSGASGNFNDGRFDIICAQPTTLFETIGSTTTITTEHGDNRSTENPFDLIEAACAELPVSDNSELPFTGGAMGYFGYHLNRHLEKLPQVRQRDVGLPDMQVGIYPWALIQDHRERQAKLVFQAGVSDDQRLFFQSQFNQKINTTNNNNSFYINELKSNCNVESYRKVIAKIQTYIRNGDVYQVNFAQRFSAAYGGDLFLAYRRLRHLLPAPYSAFLELKNQGAILCHSPELFIQIDGDKVMTKPIKGTRPRGSNDLIDQRNMASLMASAKDRAENLMIVDLLRNDLGKYCIPGSVEARDLFTLQSFENVHHLVSTITGQLKPTSSHIQALRNSFPGGSITGAPKIRAMEIINEIEDQERAAYCGSIGYISTNGKMTTNIAIRTLVANSDKVYAWGGGGIVADSDADAEYQECHDKIGILLKGLVDLGQR